MEQALRVLILDHNLYEVEQIKAILRDASFSFVAKVVVAKEEYVEALRSFHPHLILSEFSLPSFNGIAALKMAREHNPGVPFIVVSRFTVEDEGIELLRLGATDYVPKQQAVRLVPVVRRALRDAEVAAQQRVIEQKLRTSEARYRTLFNNLSDAVFVYELLPDMHPGNLSEINRAACDLLQYSRAELLGMNYNELLADDASREEIVRNHPPDAGRCSFETTLRKKDGTTVPVGVSSQLFRLGESALGLFIARDLTQTKQMEETRARLAAIVASCSDSIIGKSRDGIVTTWNSSAERMFGYTAAEAIGRHISFIVPPQRHAELGQILDSIRRGERIEERETVRLRKGGTRLHVSLVISPIVSSDGTVIGASEIAHDISNRLLLQQNQEKLIDELKDALARVKTLSGLLPICAWCKKVRDDEGYWLEVESYLRDRTDVDFSHGICPECAVRHREAARARMNGRR